jgi:hypothetical protein
VDKKGSPDFTMFEVDEVVTKPKENFLSRTAGELAKDSGKDSHKSPVKVCLL